MNLRDKQFEKSLRRRVRVELRKSPGLWREFRRVRTRWWRRDTNISPGVSRCILGLVLAGFLAGTFASIARPLTFLENTLLAAVLGVIVFRTGQLWLALGPSPRMRVFAHLPLTDEQVFDLQWRHFLRTAAWSIYDFTILCSFLAVKVGYGWKAPFIAFALAVGLWLVIVSAAACLMVGKLPTKMMKFIALTHRLRSFRLALLCIPLAALYVAFRNRYFSASSLAGVSSVVPPIGWIFYALGVSPPHNYLIDSWSALSFSTMLFTAPLALQRLRANYQVPELTNTAAVASGLTEAQRRREDDGSNPDAFAAIKARIRTREFLQEFNWQRAGWVERIAGRWLTPSQRITAEFLSAGSPAWTRQILRLGLILCGAALLVWFFPQILGFAGVVFIGVVSLMQAGRGKGNWPGASIRQISGSNISMYATYPIGFWQIAGVAFKVHLARSTLFFPFVSLAAFACFAAAQTPWLTAGLLAGKAMTVLLVYGIVQPVGLVSNGTNDGAKLRIILSIILWALLGILSLIFLWIAPGVFTFLLAAATLLGLCVAALWIYGRAYNHGWFDLQATPKQTTSARPQ